VTRWLADHTATGGTAIDLATKPRVGQFHDMAREYRVQTQLCDVLPHVPHTIALCEDPAVIGTRS
jgi:aminoglycoside phosphotransferase (APT) family kinase protein